MNILKAIGLGSAMAIGAGAATAAPVTYDFTWTGSSNVTMAGFFTGEDTDLDNVISDGEVSFLWFEAFNNGVSLGSNSGDSVSLAGAFGFDFTFDLTTAMFNDSGTSGTDGQLWNFNGPGLGFYDGNASAGVRVSGVTYGDTYDPQNYTATLRPQMSAVPLPAGLPMLLGAFGIMAVVRKKRASKA